VGWALIGGAHDSRLLVLEATWREMLGAISPESLAAEGHTSMASFRDYWTRRTKRRFAPLEQIQVYRVRPFTEEDTTTLGVGIIRRLYRGHLP
jgi:hypothetical protein